MPTVGVDIGSLATKAVVVNHDGQMLSYHIQRTGARPGQAGVACMREALSGAGLALPDVRFVVSTGYGRERVDFSDLTITEISCHAKGIHFLFPEVRTVIDIGGQDSKVITVDEMGQPLRFVMNDKCAAGTGRFIEVMAGALEVELSEIGNLSLRSQEEVQVSAMCTVFAESEVISLVASGAEVEDIAAAVHRAIARRVVNLAERVRIQPPVAMSGGVAKNVGVLRALEERLQTIVHVASEPQIVGALGAALFALERCSVATTASTQ